MSLAINNGLAFTSSRHDGTQVSASLSSSKALRPRREHHVRRLSEGEVGVVHVPRGNTATSLNVVSWAPERKGLARPLKRLALRRPILASWAAWGAGRALFRRGTLSRMGGPSFFPRALGSLESALEKAASALWEDVLVRPHHARAAPAQGTSRNLGRGSRTSSASSSEKGSASARPLHNGAAELMTPPNARGPRGALTNASCVVHLARRSAERHARLERERPAGLFMQPFGGARAWGVSDLSVAPSSVEPPASIDGGHSAQIENATLSGISCTLPRHAGRKCSCARRESAFIP